MVSMKSAENLHTCFGSLKWQKTIKSFSFIFFFNTIFIYFFLQQGKIKLVGSLKASWVWETDICSWLAMKVFHIQLERLNKSWVSFVIISFHILFICIALSFLFIFIRHFSHQKKKKKPQLNHYLREVERKRRKNLESILATYISRGRMTYTDGLCEKKNHVNAFHLIFHWKNLFNISFLCVNFFFFSIIRSMNVIFVVSIYENTKKIKNVSLNLCACCIWVTDWLIQNISIRM